MTKPIQGVELLLDKHTYYMVYLHNNKKHKNISNIDSDNDGLSDFEEINKYGTDPNNPDTDGDGIKDGDEIKLGTNPMIKDFFIPNERNNYRPHALRPKRLLFYGFSAFITKIIVFTVVVSFPLSAWLSPNILYEEGRKIINLTNQVRINLGLKNLNENQKLNDSAMNKAQDMLINQYFAHTSPSGQKLSNWLSKSNYNYKFAGENLAIGFDTAEGVIEAWKQSPTHYSNIIDPDFTEIGVGVISGQYSGYDTILIAQHFGASKENIIPTQTTSPTSSIEIKQNTPTSTKKEVLSTKEQDTVTSTIEILESPSNEKIIKATANLDTNTEKASINYQNTNIELTKNESGENEWTGSAIIPEEKTENQNIITPATIETINNSGDKAVYDVNNNNIIPNKASLQDQYTFTKLHKPNELNGVFDISSIYYKIILGLVLILLFINVFVKIKIQKPDIIFSSISLIIAMFLFIIY